MGICDGRVVIVTGAARGLGRAHALTFAAEGARVVVNDLGVELDGTSARSEPAEEVVEEIRAAGGEAIANGDDIADWDGAARLVRTATETFGDLHVVVNNAGFVRDRMFANAEEDEWDAVVRVHLKGHFAASRHAAAYWRDRSKAGDPVDGRILNTSSGAGLLGSVGQAAYSAAKAGIATLTLVQAAELGRYGVTANAIAPSARTRMTEGVFTEMMARPDSGFDAMDPANVSPLVVWLGSAESRDVTGRVFEIEGGKVSVADGWHHGPARDKADRWAPSRARSGRAVAARRAATPRSRLRRFLAHATGSSSNRLVMAMGTIRLTRRPARANRASNSLLRALAALAGVDEHLEVEGLDEVVAVVRGHHLLEHEDAPAGRERLAARCRGSARTNRRPSRARSPGARSGHSRRAPSRRSCRR